MKKGQISLPIMITIGGLVATAVAGVYGMTANLRKDVLAEVGAVSKEVSAVSERTGRVETVIPLMQTDIRDIKDSLKRIEGYLQQKPIK